MLYIVATPIGNLGDLSQRALKVFKSADIIACEDTRRTWALLSACNIPRPRMLSYRQGNERQAGRAIITALQAGEEVVLCSDGGYPGISDPGYRLICELIEAELPYTVIPGASAVEISLLASGLPTSSFTFKGFPPRKPGTLLRFFAEEAAVPHTLVFFESPFRVSASLKAALQAMGDRKAAVCIELTKLHERIERGYLSELIPLFDKPVKGEVTMVIAGNNPKFEQHPTDQTTS